MDNLPKETGVKENVMHLEKHTGGLPQIVCSCGWTYRHGRGKVLAKAVNRHAQKTGHHFINRKSDD